ncbi:hypothetical protein A2U01_0099450, partial [Trifolium medium]|nr:hypothetical protein [Trifolium medium]
MSSFCEDVGGSQLPRRCRTEVISRLYVSKFSNRFASFPLFAGSGDGDPSSVGCFSG